MFGLCIKNINISGFKMIFAMYMKTSVSENNFKNGHKLYL